MNDQRWYSLMLVIIGVAVMLIIAGMSYFQQPAGIDRELVRQLLAFAGPIVAAIIVIMSREKKG